MTYASRWRTPCKEVEQQTSSWKAKIFFYHFTGMLISLKERFFRRIRWGESQAAAMFSQDPEKVREIFISCSLILTSY